MRVLRRPGDEVRYGDARRTGIFPPGKDHRAAGFGIDLHHALIIPRRDAQRADVFRRNALGPYRLPNAALRRVPHTAALHALFAAAKGRGVRVIAHGHDQLCRTVRRRKARQVNGKGRVSAHMTANLQPIAPNHGALVHGTEVQQQPPVRYRETRLQPIPEIVAGLDQPRNTRGRSLRRKGHEDLPVPHRRRGGGTRDGVVPLAAEVDPLGPLHLRSGIFIEHCNLSSRAK